MGSWLVDSPIESGHEVVSADNLLGGKKENVNPDCKFVKADLSRGKEQIWSKAWASNFAPRRR